jgi:hypothetical protein
MKKLRKPKIKRKLGRYAGRLLALLTIDKPYTASFDALHRALKASDYQRTKVSYLYKWAINPALAELRQKGYDIEFKETGGLFTFTLKALPAELVAHPMYYGHHGQLTLGAAHLLNCLWTNPNYTPSLAQLLVDVPLGDPALVQYLSDPYYVERRLESLIRQLEPLGHVISLSVVSTLAGAQYEFTAVLATSNGLPAGLLPAPKTRIGNLSTPIGFALAAQ